MDTRMKHMAGLLIGTTSTLCAAMTADWCVRPEASEYRRLGLKSASGVRAVHYPRGDLTVGSEYPTTIHLDRDGLIERIDTKYPKDVCSDTFVRGPQRQLEMRATTCKSRPGQRDAATYQYTSNGWIETNRKGQRREVAVTRPSRTLVEYHHAKWRVDERNVDQSQEAAGAVTYTNFNAACREVGEQSFQEMRVQPGVGMVQGPRVDMEFTVSESFPPGALIVHATKNGKRFSRSIYGTTGFEAKQELYSPVEVVFRSEYIVDQRGNWTRWLRTRQPADGTVETPNVLERTLTYY